MQLLRAIPKVDVLLENPALNFIAPRLKTRLIRETLEALRAGILAGEVKTIDEAALIDEVKTRYEKLIEPSFKPLINATGVVVHTNLGRSILDAALIDEIKPLLTGYSNLEYDIAEGKRGSRYTHLGRLMREVLGCEEVLVVNNNAAAVFLILNTFAQNKEAIVSRGELVEIGGSFRIPDVMRQSGAVLREVGTTNKTHLSDYEQAANENTALLMKVHRSNFAIKGFTSEVDFAELIVLAREKGLIDYFDLGSGQLVDLGVGDEPLLTELAALNPSLVSFSGDKLFGGVQAGVIFGKKALIDKLKKNQLLRMLRVDKFTLAALEATLRRYLAEKVDEIPTVRMIKAPVSALEIRARKLTKLLLPIKSSIEKTQNFVGGGALPEEAIAGCAVVLGGNVENLHENLRLKGVIARVENNKLYLEMRTVFDNDLKKLAIILKEVVA
ncbi:MAG: L-seryl-tRNA(Sec) selenium transferase [Campylobacterales bacterium]